MSTTNKTRFHLPDGPEQAARDAEMAAGATDWSFKAVAWIYEHDAAAAGRAAAPAAPAELPADRVRAGAHRAALAPRDDAGLRQAHRGEPVLAGDPRRALAEEHAGERVELERVGALEALEEVRRVPRRRCARRTARSTPSARPPGTRAVAAEPTTSTPVSKP